MSSVIRIENLGKQYRLGEVGTGTLMHDLNQWWYKIRGKENPYLRVGEVNDRSKKGNSDLVWALQKINFEVSHGEVLGIIGKNGAGKSTLLKILSRVTSPTVGSIKVKGRIASLLEVGTGFHPELSGRENIFLNGAILGMTKKEISSKFDEIVDFSGVERYIDTPVKRYSSGMYVRLAFAVAAHLEPEILVVDEVLVVGDADFQRKCLGKIKDVAGHGRTVLFVSHNMTAVTSLCTNAVYLNSGQVAGIGDPVSMVTKYLNDGAERSSAIKWSLDTAPGDHVARLLEAKLVNQNREIVDFTNINEGFGVEFTYKLSEDVVEPIPQVHVFTQKDEKAFIGYGDMQNGKIKPGVKGEYTSVVWFPPDLFNAGIYNIAIGFVDYEGPQLHFYVENAISFEVIENLNNRNISFRGAIGGVLRPKLKWETHAI